MLKRFLSTTLASLFVTFFSSAIFAAERHFEFSEYPLNETPTHFINTVTGEGKPGVWKVIEVEVPPLLAPLSPTAKKSAKRTVLAQLAEDPTDEHFPLFISDDESYSDFTVSTRFKIVRGTVEQMAGIAFRIKDEKNYYIVRASALGNNFRFYKFVNGQRSAPIGPEVLVSTNDWHELKIECKGNQIRAWMDGKDLIAPDEKGVGILTDTSFTAGKIGFWTKSDSVCYFVDTKVDYVPTVSFAQSMVRDTMKKYPRLLGLKIFALKNSDKPTVIASADEKEIGAAGGEAETNVLQKGLIGISKSKESINVTLPLRDRNGDIAGALRTSMKPFAGETQDNAIARAVVVKAFMEEKLAGATGLLQ